MGRKKKIVTQHDLTIATSGKVILELIQYNDTDFHFNGKLGPDDVLTRISPGYVNWINLDGLHDRLILDKLANYFCLHPLLLEDITTDHQPKAEEFDDYFFFTMKMLYRIINGVIDYEQVSFVMGKDYLISFQEKEGDLFDAFRERIRLSQGKVRKLKNDYLLYRLTDIIVDNYYSVLDEVGSQIEIIEDQVYSNPSEENFLRIQKVKKDLLFLRKVLNPLRDALGKVTKDESDLIQTQTIRYFSDVYDHVVHLIDALDTYNDLTSGLMDIHINAMNTRMNEVIKVLTVISTIFMPLTFLVGVYGMNFKNMPELDWRFGYLAVWIVIFLMTIGMISYFKYRKWF
jgi:magnesium transporter